MARGKKKVEETVAVVESAAVEETVKETAPAEEKPARKTRRKAAPKAEEKAAVEAAAAPVEKKPAARAKKAVPTIVLEYGEAQWNTADLPDRAMAVYAETKGISLAEAKKAKEIALYVKPEEATVYFVIDGEPGQFTL